MIRKSKEQRITDIQAALTRWEAAGRTREVLFMRDMAGRLGRGKGLSPAQRKWLDDLCSSSPPPPPEANSPLLARCAAALEHATPRDASIISDMAGRLRRGWKLSEKQTAFLERLLTAAERVATEGPWRPDPTLLAEGVFAAQVAVARGNVWKGTHPSVMGAAERILAYAGPQGGDPGRPTFFAPADEWCFKKVIESMGPAVREFRKPRFSEGDMVKPRGFAPMGPGIGVVVSGPLAVGGEVGYEVLFSGRPGFCAGKNLTRVK
jgi:hypothetical protein